MRVECVYANSENQYLITLTIHEGATIAEVIRASNVLENHPELVLKNLVVGIFGQKKSLIDFVKEGDRVEIYRPLMIDPMEARRQRAPAPKRRKY